MGRRPKEPEAPNEICIYCETDVPCVWTVKVGANGYAMCKDCAPEAQKDFFSFSLRTDEDRKRSKGDDEPKADGE